jgi:hypothetical protein
MNDHANPEKTVEALNDCIMTFMWMDFEIIECNAYKLILIGSIDPSDDHDIEIEFDDIAFVQSPISWRTDTSKPPVTLVSGSLEEHLNRLFKVESGYSIFRFSPDYYPSEFGCYIGARNVSYKRCRGT